MFVYNIRKERYATTLKASGVANRWNKADEYIVYTGSSRALAALELLVHRSAVHPDDSYKLLVIQLAIVDEDIEELQPVHLPKDWYSIKSYPTLQNLGSAWYQEREKLILKVPSAIIPKEHNYLLNTKHPDFHKKVSLIETEAFNWDNRLL